MVKKSRAKVSRNKRTKSSRLAAKSTAKAAVTKKTKKTRTTKRGEPSLGRPKVTAEEQLYMLFHEDYHARQVFDFLRVQTVKDLEQYSPQQIVRLLSKPITETVNRIRRKLAEKNRHLQDDVEFAVECKHQAET